MKNFIKITSALALAGFLASCLKDDKANLTPDNSPPVVEFSTIEDAPVSPVGSVFALYARAYERAPSVEVPLTVNYTGGHPAPQDVTVNIGVSKDAVKAYNEQQTTEYGVLLPSLYTIPASVTIPKGQRKATVVATVKLDQVDFDSTYVLPVSIQSVSTGNVSANYGTILVSINPKNEYDGVYDFKGRVVRSGDDGTLDGNFSGYETTLATVNATTNGLDQVWKNNTGVAGIGTVQLRINPTTNKVTISSPVNATLVNDPAYDSRYDPATKTYYISYYWRGGPADRAATDTLTFKHK